jgi:hypothetical protein
MEARHGSTYGSDARQVVAARHGSTYGSDARQLVDEINGSADKGMGGGNRTENSLFQAPSLRRQAHSTLCRHCMPSMQDMSSKIGDDYV